MKPFIPVTLGAVAILATACTSGPAPTSPTSTNTSTSTTTTAGAGDDIHKQYEEQLKNQDADLNTGVVYWLELERDGKKSRVSNKTAFVSGDKMRFHIKPNVNAYAYILMEQGSKGDKAVLFPNDDNPENKVKAGEEVVLPLKKGSEEAWLKFDENPGTEVVRVLVSKKKVDAESELNGGNAEKVKMTSSSSDEDTIPEGNLVAVVISESASKPAPAKNLTVETTTAHPESEGETTIVSTTKNKPLAIDVAMEHKSP